MKVLATDLYDLGFDAAVSDLIAVSNLEPDNKLISASDAHLLVLARTQPDFAEVLRSFYLNLPDGTPSAWILKWKGAKNANRISGPAFFKAVILATKNQNIGHYLCGGADGVAEELRLQCEAWGNHNIVGTISPPFRTLKEEDYQAITNAIQEAKSNIVWVGLGAPKQIYFANELVKYCSVQAIVTIGAAFDFHTNRVSKAPEWIEKMGMEWLYRLIQEPKRLFKRYFKTVPLFIYYNLVELVRPSKRR